ncbi:MAG: ATP-binding protein [Candidatus Thorarchaeota archaeon]|nr:4Fe-4S dicluster domain-containing protein [Chloroflexota bacterium]
MASGLLLPTVVEGLCTHCGRCVALCPSQAITLGETGPEFVNPEACTYCGECEAICPTGAIILPYTIEWDGSPDPSKASRQVNS